jgi:hypothetical protein
VNWDKSGALFGLLFTLGCCDKIIYPILIRKKLKFGLFRPQLENFRLKMEVLKLINGLEIRIYAESLYSSILVQLLVLLLQFGV